MWHPNLRVEILQEFAAFDGKRSERLWAFLALHEERKRAGARHYAWLHRCDPKVKARQRANLERLRQTSPKRQADLKRYNSLYRKRFRAEKRIKRGIVETPCKYCGVSFIHGSYVRGGQPAKYCSPLCRRRGQKPRARKGDVYANR